MEKIIRKQNLKNEGEVVFTITLVKRSSGFFLLSNNFKTEFEKFLGTDRNYATMCHRYEIKAAKDLIKDSKLVYRPS